MKKLLSLFISLSSLLYLASCSFDLGFEPVRLYKFSASLKYVTDNGVLQKNPEIQLFTSYENTRSYFDEYTCPYGSESRKKVEEYILENVDFERFNLLGYMNEEGTNSILHAVSVDENNVTIYFYTPEVVTDDMACKWLIFTVDKKYELLDFVIETQRMIEKQANHLRDNFDEDYYF